MTFLNFNLLQLAKLVLDDEESDGMDRDDIMADLCMDDRGDQKTHVESGQKNS